MRREVKRLKVICANKQFGCDFIGELEKYFNVSELTLLLEAGVTSFPCLQEHIDHCKYKPVACPNKDKGCSELISANEVQRHIAEECQFRDVKCQYCYVETTQHSLQVSLAKFCCSCHVLCSCCCRVTMSNA